jgi:ribosomal protein L37AE/L43A
MRIEERVPCPRCGQRRVVERSRNTYLCFQCRHGWTHDPSAQPPQEPVVTFTLDELYRLIAYREAIRAGLYTDWPTRPSPEAA